MPHVAPVLIHNLHVFEPRPPRQSALLLVLFRTRVTAHPPTISKRDLSNEAGINLSCSSFYLSLNSLCHVVSSVVLRLASVDLVRGAAPTKPPRVRSVALGDHFRVLV